MLTLSKIGTSSILHSLNRIIENSRDVGVKLPKGVLQQVEARGIFDIVKYLFIS